MVREKQRAEIQKKVTIKLSSAQHSIQRSVRNSSHPAPNLASTVNGEATARQRQRAELYNPFITLGRPYSGGQQQGSSFLHNKHISCTVHPSIINLSQSYPSSFPAGRKGSAKKAASRHGIVENGWPLRRRDWHNPSNFDNTMAAATREPLSDS